jgi:hypothetical protein
MLYHELYPGLLVIRPMKEHNVLGSIVLIGKDLYFYALENCTCGGGVIEFDIYGLGLTSFEYRIQDRFEMYRSLQIINNVLKTKTHINTRKYCEMILDVNKKLFYRKDKLKRILND